MAQRSSPAFPLVPLLASLCMLAGCGGDSTSDDGSSGRGGSSGGSGASGSNEFSALTYNVAGLPELLSGSEPELNMPLISPLLNDYDLVLVQEDWLTPDPNPLPSARVYHDLLAAEANHPYQTIPAPIPFGEDPRRPSALLSDGLNEFSQFELGELVREPWAGCFGGTNTSDGGAGDCLALKGFSVALHRFAEGVELDVYNLHAEAGGTAEDDALRASDFEQLAAFLNQRSEGRAVIVGGDTNLRTEAGSVDAAVWQAFQSSTGVRDVCSVVDCGSDADVIDKFAFRSGADITLEPLSHAFEREKFSRSDGTPLSDHDALAVRFRWSAGR